MPDWIDGPRRDVEIEQSDDAVGKLVVATQDVEAWLAFVAYLGACSSYSDAARLRATQLVVKIRQSAKHVPIEDQPDLRSAIRRTSEILDFRNAVVHAMPWRYADGLQQEIQDLHPPPREVFSIEMLLGAAAAAESVVDYFSSRIGAWPQARFEASRNHASRQ